MTTKKAAKEADLWEIVNELKAQVASSQQETLELKRQLVEEKRIAAEGRAEVQAQLDLACSDRGRTATPADSMDQILVRMTSAIRDATHPTLSLPEFNGRSRDWPKFKMAVDRLRRDRTIDPLEAFTLLEKSLKGEAAESVARLMVEPENFDRVMERLQKEYGNVGSIYQALLNDLLKTEKPTLRRPRTFIVFMRALEDLVSYMASLDRHEYLNDQRLLTDLIDKLPDDLQHKWYGYQLRNGDSGSLRELAEWLKPTEELAIVLHANKRQSEPREETPRRLQADQGIGRGVGLTCHICKRGHQTSECRRLRYLNVEESWDMIRRFNLCSNCLDSHSHNASQCNLPPQCQERGCRQRHHTLLHRVNTAGPSRRLVGFHKTTDHLYYQIVPVKVTHGKQYIHTYAFLDTGSAVSLMKREVQQELRALGFPKPMEVVWSNGDKQEELESEELTVSITGQDGQEHVVEGVRTVQRLELPEQSIKAEVLASQYRHLRAIDLPTYENGRPTILLGLPHAHLMYGMAYRAGDPGEPIAIKTPLGWAVMGGKDIWRDVHSVCKVTLKEVEEKNMEEIMKNYFSVEGFGVSALTKTPRSEKDERAEMIMKSTLKKEGNSYEIGLLWKQDVVMLPESYNQALRRLGSFEKKLSANPGLNEWYHKEIASYESKGYAYPIGYKSDVPDSARNNFIPHFAVVNYNKPNPKPRLVFDAAAENEGVSLNSCILTGPDLGSSLFGVLIRFRENAIGISGDIKEMFHRVKIRKEDRNSQMFLYRRNPKDKPMVYQMAVMIFGSACSPTCAQYVKNTNAMAYQQAYPKAVEAIVRNHYVDDYLDSFATEDEAICRVKEVCEIHDKAEFFIRNFISNSERVIKALPLDRVSETSRLEITEEKFSTSEKVLGHYWNTKTDVLTFVSYHKVTTGDAITKRIILASIMKIFDPLGLLANVTIEAKLLLQDVWRLGIEWDSRPPENIVVRWQEWVQRLVVLNNWEVPRCYSPVVGVSMRELHVFVDASERAFGAVAYLRTVHKDGVMVTIVAAKSRVAPTKPLSIPRLELQAAVLGVRLGETIKREIRLAIQQTIFWSDSKTVLAWIASEPRKYTVFVALRIGEILETTTKHQWGWVSTKENPADQTTKPRIAGQTDNRLWLQGPQFLKDAKVDKPNWELETQEEARPVLQLRVLETKNWNCLNVTWASSWAKLKRGVAIIILYIKWLQAKVKKSELKLEVSKDILDEAERMLVMKAQWEEFKEEIVSLGDGQSISVHSKIRSLNPQLSPQGLLRASGRLSACEALPFDVKYPIILPKGHYITRLIVGSYHQRYLHQKFETTLAAIRQKYWVIHARTVLKKVVSACQRCRNVRSKPMFPQMAPLPKARTTGFNKPFTYTGVDYFGPLNVSVGRRREKRWGALFTCLTTRAVHLELASDLSTDAFLMCLRSMQNRRGRIVHLFCDNGTNFVGASREMLKLRQRCAGEGIEFHFNPPAAPHFGGAWERMVKEVKSLLPLGKEEFPEAVLRAALTEIEAIINNRPLTHVPLNHDDEEPLTPNHFLIGCHGDAAPTLEDISHAETLKSKWKRVQLVALHYWTRWSREYLPQLMKREKWQDKVPPLAVGDVVTFPNEQSPGKWLKGRVVQVYAGKDKQVRTVTIRHLNTIVKRPACKVARLPVMPGDQNNE